MIPSMLLRSSYHRNHCPSRYGGYALVFSELPPIFRRYLHRHFSPARPGAGRPKGVASRANEQVRQEAAATGELPLAYRLRIMRDPSQPVGRRDEMAKAAAPFCHSRLSSVEHSGEISRPTVIRAPTVS